MHDENELPLTVSAADDAARYLTRFLEAIQTDTAQVAAFRGRHPILVAALDQQQAKLSPSLLERLPLSSEITALQATVFDNWPSGTKVKSKPHRYAVSVEGWTVEPDDVRFQKGKWQAKFVGDLMTHAELVKMRKDWSKRGGGPDLAYANHIIDIAEEYPNDMFAILQRRVKGDGTSYPAWHTVHLEFDGEMMVASGEVFVAPGDCIPLPSFSNLDASGKPLSPKVAFSEAGRPLGRPLFQSRYAPNSRLAPWRAK